MKYGRLLMIPVALISVGAFAATAGAPQPLGNPGDWVNSADYPASALREEAEGVVGFTLDVDAQGVPTNCSVTRSSGNPSLDSATCTLISTRARFTPATDKKGAPVAGTWSSSVRWQIPTGPNTLPGPADYTVSFVVEEDGSVTGCTFSGLDHIAPLRGPCDAFASQKFDPPTDDNGNSVRRKIVIHNTVTSEIVQK